MNKIKYAVGAAASVIAAGVLFAGPAHADETSFVNAVHSAGQFNSNGDSGIVAAGLEVCQEIENGYSVRQAIALLYRVSTTSFSVNDSKVFVVTALADLCPEALRDVT